MSTVPESIREQVRQRAGGRCEYCGKPEEASMYPHHIEHIIVYKLPSVIGALLRAAARGVSLRICVEAPEPSGYRMAQDTLDALGSDIAQRAAIYIWPEAKRPVSPTGSVGSLHTKCAVADGKMLFVSSANLTGHAMQLNMELGILVRGGPLPAQVSRYFERLIDKGVLVATPSP